MNASMAIVTERGCGTRIKSGIYAELGMSPFGRPLEDFLLDPTIPLPDTLLKSINKRGVTLIKVGDGLYHGIDWVGEVNYPNPVDDLEEIRRFGMSARLELARPEEYEKITEQTRILRAHALAWLEEEGLKRLWADRQGVGPSYTWNYCPKYIPEHMDLDLSDYERTDNYPMCIGLLYENVSGAELVEKGSRRAVRKMPSFEYQCCIPPVGAVIPRELYRPAFYASFPISRLVIVRAPGDAHKEKYEKIAKHARLQFDEVDE